MAERVGIMRKGKRKKCTTETTGTIIKTERKSPNMPTMITVEYVVDGVMYTVKESVKLKSEAIKIGFLPIGQRRIPRMGNITEGNTVAISYNPEKPEMAYVKENVGIVNV